MVIVDPRPDLDSKAGARVVLARVSGCVGPKVIYPSGYTMRLPGVRDAICGFFANSESATHDGVRG